MSCLKQAGLTENLLTPNNESRCFLGIQSIKLFKAEKGMRKKGKINQAK